MKMKIAFVKKIYAFVQRELSTHTHTHTHTYIYIQYVLHLSHSETKFKTLQLPISPFSSPHVEHFFRHGP